MKQDIALFRHGMRAFYAFQTPLFMRAYYAKYVLYNTVCNEPLNIYYTLYSLERRAARSARPPTTRQCLPRELTLATSSSSLRAARPPPRAHYTPHRC